MPDLAALIRASHPEPGAAVTLAAALLAAAVGHGPWGVAGVAAAIGATQLSVGWVNDWLDADRDAISGRSDKPLATGAVSRRTVGRAGLAASLAVPLLGAPFGPAAAACVTLAAVSALLYDWPLKATPFSVVPYLVSFGLLPAFVVLALPGHPGPPLWLVAAGALLGGGAHFANALPDLADDARTGIIGLPHRLGHGASLLVAALLLVAATVTLTVGPPGPPSWPGWVATAVSVVVLPLSWYASSTTTGRSTAMFRAVIAVALMDVILLVISGRAAVPTAG
jgi:heme o synthase